MVGDSGWSSEYQNAENVDRKSQVLEVLGGNKDSIDIWTRDQVCYTLAENLPIFYPCPETQQETEIKFGVLMNGKLFLCSARSPYKVCLGLVIPVIGSMALEPANYGLSPPKP